MTLKLSAIHILESEDQILFGIQVATMWLGKELRDSLHHVEGWMDCGFRWNRNIADWEHRLVPSVSHERLPLVIRQIVRGFARHCRQTVCVCADGMKVWPAGYWVHLRKILFIAGP